MKIQSLVKLNIDDILNVAEVKVSWELSIVKEGKYLQVKAILPAQDIKIPKWDDKAKRYNELDLEMITVNEGKVHLSSDRDISSNKELKCQPSGLFFNSDTCEVELWVTLES